MMQQSMASSPRREGEEDGVGDEEEEGEEEGLPSRRYLCEYEEIPSERWSLSSRSSRAPSFSSFDVNPSTSTDGGPERILPRELSGLLSSPPGRKNKKTSGRPPMSKLWRWMKKPPKMEAVVGDVSTDLNLGTLHSRIEIQLEKPVVDQDDFAELHMGNFIRYSNKNIQLEEPVEEDDFAELLLGKLRRYPENEIQLDTDGLRGHDYCGVYTGRTRTGEYVTVKRYRKSDGLYHLETELRATSVCRHRNVVECIGWFRRNGDIHLVFEFLLNTLGSLLEPNAVLLTWETRYKICLDLASAILHMHEKCRQCVLHGDIEPGHILLDSKLNAKLADFESARFRQHDEVNEEEEMRKDGVRIEYYRRSFYTKASDVYSFGIVLLQLATGLLPFRRSRELIQEEPSSSPSTDEETPYESLFDWVLERHLGNKLLDVVDKRLGSEFDKFAMECVLQTGLVCAQSNSQLRPSIYEATAYLRSGVPVSALLNINSDSQVYDLFPQLIGYLQDKLQVKEFTFHQLRNATNCFSYANRVYIGGNGVIFEGYMDIANTGRPSLERRMHVAIKKMYGGHVFGRTEFFVGEIKTLSVLKHQNIVPLIGWCCKYDKYCYIIYEFMANDNLFFNLRPTSRSLTWKRRYLIALDLACVIHYIHEEHEVCILHTNITSTNVLLDENYTCKLTGFETAATELKQDIKGATQRTPCYMDPEALQEGTFSKASDIYSFGLVILELACGKAAVHVNEHGRKIYLYEEVLDLYNKGALLEAADERLNKQFDEEEMERLLIVGLSCAQRSSGYRPSIKQVVDIFNLRIPLSDLLLWETPLSSSSSSSSREVASEEPSTIYSDTLESSITNADIPEPVRSITSICSTPSISDNIGIHADTTPAQEKFDIGIPPHYSYPGPYKEFHLQVMKGCMSRLHEKIKSGARFVEVVETLRTLTAVMVTLQAPLDEWDCLAQYVLRTLKQIETLKAKCEKEDLCPSSSDLSILREEMERYIENDEKDGEQAAAIQEEYNLLLYTKRDLEKQLAEVQDKIRSLKEEKEAIEERRKRCEEVLEHKQEECSVLVLYDMMLSRVASFSSV